MTLMQETSLRAFNELKKDCRLQPEELKVVVALDLYGPLADFEIVEKTGMMIQSVTGRRNSLVRKGLVVIRGTKRNPHTGKKNIVWGLYSRLF